MMNVVAIVHLLFCISLIALVLLQDPKSSGGGMFGGGGGGANTLLGATGAASFLEKLTRYSAVFFGVTCLVLTLMSRPEQGSVLDGMPAKAANTPVNAAGPAGPVTAASPAPAGATGPGATAPTGNAATSPTGTSAAAPAAGDAKAPAPAASAAPAK